nr:uncharacterized protein LOC104090442 [Nicotiana tomentosiformis]
MYIKRNGEIEASPSYALRYITGGLMKHQPTKYVRGMVDYFDYVKPTDLNMTELRKMTEICSYVNDSVIFWHKYGKFGNILRLVSTEVEASRIAKSIPKDNIVEIYFEHLDYYFEMAEIEPDNC